ncbi:MFS transporter [Actinoplanes sp. NBRC 14428]|nr:MFS transporter [Actinoplanes sp. NBRC 14428]
MPLAALIFLLLPWTTSLITLAAVMFCYALLVNTTRPLAESLVPDFLPPQRRSRANAVVKIATALTIIVASLISLLVVDEHPHAAFAIPSLIMLAGTAVLLLNVRDNTSPAYRAAAAEDGEGGTRPVREPMRRIIRRILTDTDRRPVLLLLAVLLFGGAWFASRSLITPYGMEVLGLSRGDAGGLTLPSGLVYVAAAYPAALLAERFGRLRTIGAGMVLFAVALATGTLVQTPTGTVVAFCAGSIGAAAFTINAAVALWNLAPSSRFYGAYTGLYAVTWYLGGFGGPALIGGVVDLFGWTGMLTYIGVLALLAVLVVVRLGRLQQAHRAERAVSLTERE